MAEIHTYEVRMELSGRMTQLPDSQKLFGALMHLYSEHTSTEKVTEFVQSVNNKGCYCALSDMLPVGYLPAPQSYLLEDIRKNNAEECKRIYKEVKKREYIKQEQFQEIMKKKDSWKEIMGLYPYIRIQYSQQIHAVIDSLHYGVQGLNPNLYSVPEATVLEVKKNKSEHEQSSPVKEFCFYLSIEQSENEKEIKEALESAHNRQKTFFLGPRASQGLNIFTIKEIKNIKNSFDKIVNYYLNLGMLLPDRINWEDSYLSYFTSERRPYHNPEGWDKKQVQKFISFIKAGSIIFISEDCKQAGGCISIPDSNTIIFGNSLLYPIGQQLGRE